MLRLVLTLVLALPSILVEAVMFGIAHRRVARKGVEQSRDYVPSWAKPEGSSSADGYR